MRKLLNTLYFGLIMIWMFIEIMAGWLWYYISGKKTLLLDTWIEFNTNKE